VSSNGHTHLHSIWNHRFRNNLLLFIFLLIGTLWQNSSIIHHKLKNTITHIANILHLDLVKNNFRNRYVIHIHIHKTRTSNVASLQCSFPIHLQNRSPVKYTLHLEFLHPGPLSPLRQIEWHVSHSGGSIVKMIFNLHIIINTSWKYYDFEDKYFPIISPASLCNWPFKCFKLLCRRKQHWEIDTVVTLIKLMTKKVFPDISTGLVYNVAESKRQEE